MAQESFVSMPDEPKNSLGRTDEVVAAIEAKPERMQELFECFLQPDEWVRLRASSTTKRIWKSHPEWLDPYLEGWVAEVAALDHLERLVGDPRKSVAGRASRALARLRA